MSLFKRGGSTDLEANLASLFKRGEPTDLDKSTEVMEAEIRELAHRDVVPPRQAPQVDRELVTNDIGALLHRVAGSSVAEIDRLMSELQTLRDLLHSEGARVQRQIAVYAHLNQTVVQSTNLREPGEVRRSKTLGPADSRERTAGEKLGPKPGRAKKGGNK